MLHAGTDTDSTANATGGTTLKESGSECLSVPDGGITMGALLSPGLLADGNWKILIPVPWKEELDVVELGLWSILSRAPTENNPFFKHAGATQPSSLKRSLTDVASDSSISIIQSYDTDKPS